MFLGEYHHNVDQKGRLAIPAKFRADLSHGAVITKGLDGCLFLYPTDEWKTLAEKLKSLPLTDKNARAFVRMMFAGAAEVELDKQGRANIPDHLLSHADISKETVVAGLFNRVEIWSKPSWEEYKNDADQNTSDIAEKLAELGI